MIRSAKSATVAAVLALATLTTACETNRYGDRRLNDTGRGAAIGGAAGAILGIVTSDRNRYEDRGNQRYYYDNRGRRYHYDERRKRRWDN